MSLLWNQACEIKRREPLYTTLLPDWPWQRVASDLCEYDNQDYLILTDYYSRCLDILHLRHADGAKNATAGSLITKFKDVFAQFGIPYTIISDNGPQFESHEFSEFAESYRFVHEPMSPRLPNSNGEAMQGIETDKSILGTPDPWLSLMIYHNMAVAATGCSPSQLMLHRHIRINLPALPSSLQLTYLILIQSVKQIRGRKRNMGITVIHATACALCSHCTYVMQYVSNWTIERAGIAQVLCMVTPVRHDPT